MRVLSGDPEQVKKRVVSASWDIVSCDQLGGEGGGGGNCL